MRTTSDHVLVIVPGGRLGHLPLLLTMYLALSLVTVWRYLVAV